MKSFIVCETTEVHRDGITISLDEGACEKVSIPNGYEATRSPNSRAEQKTVKLSWVKFLKVERIKQFSFSFVEANNLTSTFRDFESQSIPFFLRIDAPHVPNKNFMISHSIHPQTMRERRKNLEG